METYRERDRRDKRAYLSELLEASGGCVAKAARMAGLNRQNFYLVLKRYGVPARPQKVREISEFARRLVRYGFRAES